MSRLANTDKGKFTRPQTLKMHDHNWKMLRSRESLPRKVHAKCDGMPNSCPLIYILCVCVCGIYHILL